MDDLDPQVGKTSETLPPLAGDMPLIKGVN
jgi:hypothetical protein